MRLKDNHPAVAYGYPLHSNIKDPTSNKTPILKPVSQNSKLGKGSNVITKGKWRGFPMFSLTLAERTTCPDTCERWNECYGNSMPFAHRFDTVGLTERLDIELEKLNRVYRNGFVVRLHILGDFFSPEYVMFWANAMFKYQGLHVFGYTAHNKGLVSDAIDACRIRFPTRFWVRHSTSQPYEASKPFRIYAAKEGTQGIGCPEQLGTSESCLTCGLCWSINSTIIFYDHDVLAMKRKKKKQEATSS